MIRKAVENDLPAVLEILRDTRAEMASYGNDQWNDDYPQAADFLADIAQGSLWLLDEDGAPLAFVCLNGVQPEEYAAINWQFADAPLVLHRMAVSPAARRRGVGSRVMAFAEERARAQGLHCIRSDTYSINDKMNRLFTRCGYRQAGTMHFKGRPLLFCCYEKLV